MRFKAVVEREHFGLLAGEVKLLSELAKSCVFRLAPGLIRAIVRVDEDAFAAYASLQADRIFSEYRVESKADNVVAVEVLLANLAHALKSGAGAVRTTIKLSKRGASPFLTIVATVRTPSGAHGTAALPQHIARAAPARRRPSKAAST